MRTKVIILIWLLMVAPTLLIGVYAFRLLKHEQERIQNRAIETVQAKAQTVAESIQITVGELVDNITEQLAELPPRTPLDTLWNWRRDNPLIRNAFLWDPVDGLKFPDPDGPLDREESMFVKRYTSLFDHSQQWADGIHTSLDGESTSYEKKQIQTDAKTPSAPDPVVSDAYARKRAVRQEIFQLSKRAPTETWSRQSSAVDTRDVLPQGTAGSNPSDDTTETWSRQSSAVDTDGVSPESGCTPWFSENELFLLIWYRKNPDAPVVGVELETTAVLSRLVGLLPPATEQNAVFAILDGRGEVIHQVGGDATVNGRPPIVQAAVGPCLPHWQVAAFTNSAKDLATNETSFLFVASLVGGVLILAILTSGSLLLWQAFEGWRDAQRKTSFVSNVSHELKTPLTSIRMYAEMLTENRVDDSEKKSRYLGVIVTESERLTRLVNNVLDFSRLEQDRRRYNLQQHDAMKLTRAVVERFQDRLEDAGVTLKFETQCDECPCICDRDAFEQVLLNLLDNALKYADGGKEIGLGLRCSQKSCEIDVLDRGPGVPAGHRRRIFEKFHRVDDSLTTDKPGSGLGLSIARKLMQGMGGDLRYAPRPGGGACFTMVLPRPQRTV
jgi:signal transduction histidine kinase